MYAGLTLKSPIGSRRWPSSSNARLLPSDGRHLTTVPPNVVYRNNLHSRTSSLALPQRRYINQPRNVLKASQLDRLPGPIVKHTKPKQCEFQAIYEAFDSMKKKVALDVNSLSVPLESEMQNNLVRHQADKKKRRSGQDLVESMKIFMDSNLPPPTFSNVTPAEDWSREAENLLQELTDKQEQKDLYSSLWDIPNANIPTRKVEASFTPRLTSRLWSATSQEEVGDSDGSGFDIHRHIMKIDPSPYPGRSTASTEQSASTYSSDNDADDEGTQSSSETDCDKTIGHKDDSNLFPPFLDGSTFDSGYPSSANETDIAGGIGSMRQPAASTDSDDISEIGLAPSLSSWHTSQFPPLWHGTGASRFSSVPFPDTPAALTTITQPAQKPVPVPTPSFFTGLPGAPIPPLHLLPPPFQHAVSVAPGSAPRFQRHPCPPPPASGLAFVSTMQPLTYTTQYPVQAAPGAIRETTDRHKGPGTYQKHKAWITDDILEMIAVRDRLYKRMKKHPAPDIVEMYKKVRNMVVGMTRNAKRAYEKQHEEQRMEQQLRISRQMDKFSLLDPLPIEASQGHAQRTW